MELSPPSTEDWGSEPEPHGEGRALGGGRQSRTLLTSSALAPACAGQGLSLWGQAALHKCLLVGSGRGEAKRIQFLNWRLAGKWRSAPRQLGISRGDLWKGVKRRVSFGQDHRDIVERRPTHLTGQHSADRLHLPKQPHCIGLGSPAPSGSPLLHRLKTELIWSQNNLSSQEGTRGGQWDPRHFWCHRWVCPAGATPSGAPKWVGEGGLS